MQNWTTLFFHEEHRAVMAFVCNKKLDGIDKISNLTEPGLWRSKNIDNYIAELKSGFMIKYQTRKVEKEEVKYVSVNLDFFNIYSELRGILTDAIKPEVD